MGSFIDRKLIDSGVLETLKKNKNKYINIKEAKNLVSIYDQHVFIWHDDGSCILVVDITSEEKSAKSSSCKILTLSTTPVFEVECLSFNKTGSLLALTGKSGVMVFEVPWRYGKFNASGMEKDTIFGRSWNIAEQCFASSNRMNVVQASWHPGSPSNTHLAVLSMDNYIRFYDVTDPESPQQVIPLRTSVGNPYLSSESKIPFSACFGETTVSFDFGPPEQFLVPQSPKCKVPKTAEVQIWPIFLLLGSGDVCLLKAPLKKERHQPSPKVIGPLPMFPPSEDNYGYDACDILCLHTVPTSIVIATSNGIMYHCIVLDNSAVIEKTSLQFGSLAEECDIPLYVNIVFERVELPLTLTEDSDDIYSHPIKLHKEIGSNCKYYCSHIAGLHSVAIPFLCSIEKSIEAEGLEKLMSEDQKQECIVEHVLCTKPFAQMESLPVLGLDVSVSDAGLSLICLLASWDFVCLPLISSYFSSLPHLLSKDVDHGGNSDKSLVPAFEKDLERVLQRSVCCPYVKTRAGTSDLNAPQQWLDLLCTITQRFREDYVQKLHTAQAMLRSRVKVLTQQKEFQFRDMSNCKSEKETLKLSAERLAEKFEDANIKQQQILKRLETTLLKFQHSLPYLSKAELNMKQTLVTYEDKLQLFEASLSQIKKKLKHQTGKISEDGDQASDAKEDTTNINLTETQTKHVRELLSQESQSIAELTKTMLSLKNQVGI